MCLFSLGHVSPNTATALGRSNTDDYHLWDKYKVSASHLHTTLGVSPYRHGLAEPGSTFRLPLVSRMHNSNWNGQQLVPSEWVALSNTDQGLLEDSPFYYGHIWFSKSCSAESNDFFALGHYGQLIYVSKAKSISLMAKFVIRLRCFFPLP